MSQSLSAPENTVFIDDEAIEASPLVLGRDGYELKTAESTIGNNGIPPDFFEFPLVFVGDEVRLQMNQVIGEDSVIAGSPEAEALSRAFYENLRNEQALCAVLEILMRGEEDITLEGTPLYAERPRDASHEVGYNCILEHLRDVLTQREREVIHVGLFDDFSGAEKVNGGHTSLSDFEAQNNVKFDSVCNESELVEAATSLLEILEGRGLTFEKEGGVYLNYGSKPILMDRDGKCSCPLLDAVFQMQKPEGSQVVIHPVEFKSQQRNARAVMRAGRELENFGRLESGIVSIIDEFILPDIPEEKRAQTGERRVSQFSKLSEKYGGKWNRTMMVNGVRKIFSYFLQSEKKDGRFVGLSKALDSCLATFKDYEFPDETVNVFFDGTDITEIQHHGRNGKTRNVKF